MGRGLKINQAQSRPAQSPRFSVIILDSLNSDSHDADQNHVENLKKNIYIYPWAPPQNLQSYSLRIGIRTKIFPCCWHCYGMKETTTGPSKKSYNTIRSYNTV